MTELRPPAMNSGAPALVTGAAGFVGAALVHALLDRGGSVIALVRPAGRRLPLAHPRLRVVAAELPDLAPLTGLPTPRVIYHAAANVDPQTTGDRARCQRVIEEGSRLLGEWARERGAHLVMLSSIAAIGIRDLPEPVDEATPCCPDTPYGQSKLAAERQLAALGQDGLSLTVVRPPTLYGPNERYNFLTLCRAVARRYLVLIGGGHNRLSVMGIDNLCAALLTLGERRTAGLYVADDGEAVTLREVVRSIALALGRSGWLPSAPLALGKLAAAGLPPLCRVLGREPPLSPARLRTMTARFGLCITRLRAAGYAPVVSTRQGIAAAVGDYWRRGLL